MEPRSDAEELIRLANLRMPFGKHKGCLMYKVPEPYLLWLSSKGKLSPSFGRDVQAVLAIKENGLEHLLAPLAKPC